VPSAEHDDWRLTVRFETDQDVHGVFARFREHAAAALAADRLKHGVAVLRDGAWLRLYAASYDGLRRAQEVVSEFVELENVQVEELAERHDDEAGAWSRVELPPVPERDARRVSEHHGSGDWGAETEPDRVQVRFELHDRSEAIAFAQALTREGYDVHRRGSFLFLFADDDDDAKKLGEQLSRLAPADARLFYMDEGPRMWFL
jgi:hypothetical protein